ncbi:uncharacterized protein SPSK_08313 [Sporothrix schenckii 1099-18]|uniref:Zn(2)-C6 fungal-type domain-containing protein n=2 Tax=Sporothrix schenckii TaxID=29908 RepID=U7Q6K8_SPOS1|nr:uncharacterized protein SPSK_08313 [Sporothrix schenckii 1099-18]ERT03438.1 hypothetical protein HMPREF1624_01753 [Sporothrix schenckii ATCC 58251]KJR84112.1 hypothetical protein SPSK_08313 [Sporothrix schenckii 1099-18]
MTEPEVRRRRRPAVSCTLCRRRKIRCNREQPCSNCLRSRKNVACVYEELPPLPGAATPTALLTARSTASSITAASIIANVTDSTDSLSKPAARPRPPIHTDGIVFRNALHQQQTPPSASASAAGGLPPRPPPGTTVNSAVFGLNGLSVADISPAGDTGRGDGSSSAAATNSAANASGNTMAPTTVSTTVGSSPFESDNVMVPPELNAYNRAAHEADQSRMARRSHRSHPAHYSPEDVQSVQAMQQRIRHLEAQLHDGRRQLERPSRQATRDSRRSQGGVRSRDHHADESVPNLPHMVMSEAADNGPLAYLTIEEPPPTSTWSYNSRRRRHHHRSYRSHQSRGRHRSSRWSRSRSRTRTRTQSRSRSHPPSRSRSRSTSRQRHGARSYRYALRRSQSPYSRSQTPRSTRLPARSRSPHHGSGRLYRRPYSRSRSRSLGSSLRGSRSPSPHYHRRGRRRHHSPHSHSYSHGESSTLTPGHNPLSDRGKHHLCYSNNEFENNNNDLANDNHNLLTTTGPDHPPVPSAVNWPTKPSSITGDFFVSTRSRSFGPRERRMHMTSRSVMHKTRLFGQSHWVNSIVGFRDIFEMIDPLVTGTTTPKVFVDMQRLKHMGRIIKALRIGPAWPPPASGLHESYGLPPRALADELVECYLRSTESVYRILHVPMFRREYEALWQALAAGNPLNKADMAFLVQLKLVLAIGFATHRDHMALRTRAVRWYYAAQTWFSEPEFKAHLTMQVLQIHILLLFAREATGIGGALIWISVGDLVRSAVYMGLHRDPDRLPKRMSRLAAEMRRRLWNTILELVVASSLDAGGPVMLSMTDFDARSPSNIDDETLEESVLAGSTVAKAAVAAAATTTTTTTNNNDTTSKSLPEGEEPLQRLGGLESAHIVVTTPADPRAPSDSRANKNYIDDGGNMHGLPEPTSLSELLEQQKHSNGKWISGGTGVTKMDRPGDDGNNTRRGRQKNDHVEESRTPRKPPAQICMVLRQAREVTPQGQPSGGDDDRQAAQDEGASRAAADSGAPDAPRPSHKFTSMSVAVALRKTLPLRLAICQFLNDMGPPGTYADTLRFDRQFRVAYRALFDTLQAYSAASKEPDPANPSGTESTSSPPRTTFDHYTIAVVHLIMRRYLLCLHIPFFGASMQEQTAYAYSRRVVSDTAVRIWNASCPGIVDSSVATVDAAECAADEACQAQAASSSAAPRPGRTFVDPALARQTMLGAGPLRRLAMQASLLVAAEVKFQLIEDDTDGTGASGVTATGRAPIRPDLLSIIETALHWCLRGIEGGETNFKGYLLWRLVEKQLNGMQRGLMSAPSSTAESRMALAHELVQVAEEAQSLCMPILESMMARGIQEAAASASVTGGSVSGPGTEVDSLVRMCRIEDCPCHGMYRQLLQQQQEQQQQQALEAAQLAEQQQLLQNIPTQASFMPGIQPSLDPMSMDFTVDNYEFIMPDAQSLNIGSGEPLSWLFDGEPTQGILW